MNKNKLEYEFADDSPSKTKRSHRHRRGRGFATNRKSSASTNSSRSSSLSTQSLGHNTQRSSHQAAHLHAEEFSNNNTANDHDQNSCAGSLTYSASSSVQSGAESSNDSSFADIIKLIDSDGDGSDLKKFIEKSSHAADSLSQMGMDENPVVTAWKERANERTRQQQQQKAKQMKSKTQFTMKSSPMPSSNVDLNYSKDDSSEDENVFGDLDDTVLETIAG